jgi:hypothetical protein
MPTAILPAQAAYETPERRSMRLIGGVMPQVAVEQEAELIRLRREYRFKNGPDVEAFLQNHHSLLELLLDAVPQLRARFGADVTLQLQVGMEEGPPSTIYGVVIWKGSLASARAAREQFDESWWMENIERASGRVVFDYELA